MKLKKGIAKVVAVLMIATSVPVFAASTNGVDRVISLKEGATVDASLAPQLRIELKDNLVKGQYFYLDLENAEWEENVVTAIGSNPDFRFKRENKTRLLVEAKKDVLASVTAYRIPLIAKITSGQAKVLIVSNETVVTDGEYVFAKAEDTKSIVVAETKVFATAGELGEISIEEQYTGAFKSSKVQKIRVEIVSRGIEFDYNKGYIISDGLKGKRAYQDNNYNVKVIDSTTLEVEIPANSLNETQKGFLNFEGIKIKATDNAIYGDVRVVVSGDLNAKTEVIAARHGNYETKLTVAKDYEATAGRELADVEFTLGELVPDSLNGKRETVFTFSDGIRIEDLTVNKVTGLETGAVNPVITMVKKDGHNTNVFKVTSIAADNTKNTAVTFKATLKVPASFKGDLVIKAEGRSLEETKEATISKVKAPVEVNVTPLTAKIGFAQQEGGKIVITETTKGGILPGKLFLAFDHEDIQYTKAPQVKVIAGSISIEEEAAIVEGGLQITVNSRSREVAIVEISGGEFKVSGLITDGNYKVRVGGPAISDYSANTLWDSVKQKHNDIDEIVEQDFIYLGTKPTANKAVFIIGQTTYTVNGVNKAMDTAAYLAKEGRTMLPVRYVADALGIPSNQIKWESKEKAVTILVNKDNVLDKVIRIELGKKEMVINGVTVPMTATTEMKDNRVFVPVGEIGRVLGAHVKWDSVSQMATFN